MAKNSQSTVRKRSDLNNRVGLGSSGDRCDGKYIRTGRQFSQKFCFKKGVIRLPLRVGERNIGGRCIEMTVAKERPTDHIAGKTTETDSRGNPIAGSQLIGPEVSTLSQDGMIPSQSNADSTRSHAFRRAIRHSQDSSIT